MWQKSSQDRQIVSSRDFAALRLSSIIENVKAEGGPGSQSDEKGFCL